MLHHFSNVYIFKTFYVKQSYLIYHHRPKKEKTEQATAPEPQKTRYDPFVSILLLKCGLGVQNKHPAKGANSHRVALSDIMKC